MTQPIFTRMDVCLISWTQQIKRSLHTPTCKKKASRIHTTGLSTWNTRDWIRCFWQPMVSVQSSGPLKWCGRAWNSSDAYTIYNMKVCAGYEHIPKLTQEKNYAPSFQRSAESRLSRKGIHSFRYTLIGSENMEDLSYRYHVQPLHSKICSEPWCYSIMPYPICSTISQTRMYIRQPTHWRVFIRDSSQTISATEV